VNVRFRQFIRKNDELADLDRRVHLDLVLVRMLRMLGLSPSSHPS
jgi:hypothetical protein